MSALSLTLGTQCQRGWGKGTEPMVSVTGWNWSQGTSSREKKARHQSTEEVESKKAETDRNMAAISSSWAALSPKHTACPTQTTALHSSHYTPLLDTQEWVHLRGKKQNLTEFVVMGSCSSRKPSQTGIIPTGSASSQSQKQQFPPLPLHLR